MARVTVRQDYAALRRAAYPPLADLADALVKQDEAAIGEYRAKCLAVKEKFPKPPKKED